MNRTKLKAYLFGIPLLFLFFASMAFATSFTVGVDKGNAKPFALVDEDGASINAGNPLEVNASVGSTSITTITDDSVDVAVAGTPDPLAGVSTEFVRCVVQAKEDNTDVVVLGSATVDATLATRTGLTLTPLSSVTLENGDLENYHIDAEVSGEGVTIYCEA